MATRLLGNPFFDGLAAEHRTWLSAFDARYLVNWERMLNVNEESAFAEARVRRLMQGYGARVEPNEDLTGGETGAEPRPDFQCFAGKDKFYVEVTCISIDTATAKTAIPDVPGGETSSRRAAPFRPLTGAVVAKCSGKAKQCANLDAPALVAIGTFHTVAAMVSFHKGVVDWVLTGRTRLAWDADIHAERQVDETYQLADLDSAAFLCRDETQDVGYARSSISGLLLCRLGSEPLRVLGVLHPNPARPFNPAMLPEIEFGRVAIDRASRQLRVTWPNGDGE